MHKALGHGFVLSCQLTGGGLDSTLAYELTNLEIKDSKAGSASMTNKILFEASHPLSCHCAHLL